MALLIFFSGRETFTNYEWSFKSKRWEKYLPRHVLLQTSPSLHSDLKSEKSTETPVKSWITHWWSKTLNAEEGKRLKRESNEATANIGSDLKAIQYGLFSLSADRLQALVRKNTRHHKDESWSVINLIEHVRIWKLCSAPIVNNEFIFNTATQWQQVARSINKWKSYNDNVQLALQSLKSGL